MMIICLIFHFSFLMKMLSYKLNPDHSLLIKSKTITRILKIKIDNKSD